MPTEEEVPQVLEVNCSTGEKTIRPMTADELAQHAEDLAASAIAEAARIAAEGAREAARLSARARLIEQGFTDAEIDVMYPTLVGA